MHDHYNFANLTLFPYGMYVVILSFPISIKFIIAFGLA